MKSRLILLILTLILSISFPVFAESENDSESEVSENVSEEIPTKENFSSKVASMSEVLGIRYAANQDKIRIVVDTSSPTEFKTMWIQNPGRLIIDLDNSWISSTANREMTFNSDFATKLRLAQFDPQTVRIVIETEMTESDSNIFALPGGRSDGRVVIDIGKVLEEPVQDTKQDPDSPGEFKPKEKDESPEEIRQTVPPEPDAPDEKPRKKSKDDKSKDKGSEDKKSKDRDSDDKKSKDQKSDGKKSDDDSKKIETPSKPSKPPRQRIDLSTIPPKVLREKPLTGKLIAIDPGHGGSDAGAIGPSGLMEKTVTLNISLALRELLESQGAEVIMTRDTDIEVHEKGSRATANEELQARCDVANDAEADIFISVHIDSFTNSTAHGTTTYYDADSKLGFKLADKIRVNLIDEIETASRGTQRCNFYVVNKTDMPATLIEVAFISNTDEEKMLGSEEGIMKAAVGIAEGIKIYFEE